MLAAARERLLRRFETKPASMPGYGGHAYEAAYSDWYHPGLAIVYSQGGKRGLYATEHIPAGTTLVRSVPYVTTPIDVEVSNEGSLQLGLALYWALTKQGSQAVLTVKSSTLPTPNAAGAETAAGKAAAAAGKGGKKGGKGAAGGVAPIVAASSTSALAAATPGTSVPAAAVLPLSPVNLYPNDAEVAALQLPNPFLVAQRAGEAAGNAQVQIPAPPGFTLQQRAALGRALGEPGAFRALERCAHVARYNSVGFGGDEGMAWMLPRALPGAAALLPKQSAAGPEEEADADADADADALVALPEQLALQATPGAATVIPPPSIGLFPALAMANHSCAPSAAPVFGLVPTPAALSAVAERVAKAGGKAGAWAAVPEMLRAAAAAQPVAPSVIAVISATRALAPGEEVTFNYVPLVSTDGAPYLPWLPAHRQNMLRKTHGFRCLCARCLAESGPGAARMLREPMPAAAVPHFLPLLSAGAGAGAGTDWAAASAARTLLLAARATMLHGTYNATQRNVEAAKAAKAAAAGQDSDEDKEQGQSALGQTVSFGSHPAVVFANTSTSTSASTDAEDSEAFQGEAAALRAMAAAGLHVPAALSDVLQRPAHATGLRAAIYATLDSDPFLAALLPVASAGDKEGEEPACVLRALDDVAASFEAAFLAACGAQRATLATAVVGAAASPAPALVFPVPHFAGEDAAAGGALSVTPLRAVVAPGPVCTETGKFLDANAAAPALSLAPDVPAGSLPVSVACVSVDVDAALPTAAPAHCERNPRLAFALQAYAKARALLVSLPADEELAAIEAAEREHDDAQAGLSVPAPAAEDGAEQRDVPVTALAQRESLAQRLQVTEACRALLVLLDRALAHAAQAASSLHWVQYLLHSARAAALEKLGEHALALAARATCLAVASLSLPARHVSAGQLLAAAAETARAALPAVELDAARARHVIEEAEKAADKDAVAAAKATLASVLRTRARIGALLQQGARARDLCLFGTAALDIDV